jgi:hypothetical protein
MDSERLQRFKDRCNDWNDELDRPSSDKACDEDEVLRKRIFDLLNHPKLDKYSLVDAYYYDFSSIQNLPNEILDSVHWRDAYLLFGITDDLKVVTKLVERDDLDCHYPIENGVVKRKE